MKTIAGSKVQFSKGVRLAVVVLWFLVVVGASANNIYIAQSAAGSANGSSCANAYAYAYFNTPGNWTSGTPSGVQIGPGSTVYICGTISGSAGSTVLTFQGSGSGGSPITLTFAPGAIVQAPYCPPAAGGSAGGCISANGESYIVIDGNGQSGTIRNSSNGASSGSCPAGTCSYEQTSTLLDIQNCSNCTVQNLIVGPTYIEVQNAASENSTNEVALIANSSNVSLVGNAINNCGWCVEFFYLNNTTNFQAYNNTFSTFGHAFAVAAGSSGAACTGPCSIIHDNQIGPAGLNWDASGCPNHKDGIHYFGSGASSMAGIYVYNNWFGGDWGVCPTGFIYTDNVNPNINGFYMWNNVFVVVNATFENTNGWVTASNSGGGLLYSLNNTLVGPGVANNALAFSYYPSNTSVNVTNNVITGIDNPIAISGYSGGQIDYNLYGSALCNFGNCFTWNGSFEGSLSAWKTACSCDSHSTQNSAPMLSATGAPQSGSPVVGAGTNLTGFCIGSLTPLCSATSDGATVVPVLRPSSGPWDIGAYQYVPPPSGGIRSGPTVQAGSVVKQ